MEALNRECIGKIRQYISNFQSLFTQITFYMNTYSYTTFLAWYCDQFPPSANIVRSWISLRRNREYKVLSMCSNEKTWRNIPSDQYIGSERDVLRIISQNIVFLRLKWLTSISLCYFFEPVWVIKGFCHGYKTWINLKWSILLEIRHWNPGTDGLILQTIMQYSFTNLALPFKRSGFSLACFKDQENGLLPF